MALYRDAGQRRIAPPLRVRRGRPVAPARARAPLRRGPHRVVPVLLRCSPPRCCAGSHGYRHRRRLARAVVARLLARVPRRPRRARRLGRPGCSACASPQRAFCFARMTAARLRAEGLRGEVTVLEGEYAGPLEARTCAAGRSARRVRRPPHPGEARAGARAPRSAGLRTEAPELRGADPRRRPRARRACSPRSRTHGLEDLVEAPGFVATEEVEHDLARALCMVLPSRREGYGLVVVEAASQRRAERRRPPPRQRRGRARRGRRQRPRRRLRRRPPSLAVGDPRASARPVPSATALDGRLVRPQRRAGSPSTRRSSGSSRVYRDRR